MTGTEAALTSLAAGAWIASDPVQILGMPLTTTMTVLRLADDHLLLYSPIAMTPERRVAVEALGRVAHLYAPNTHHHLHIGEWAAAFGGARVHAPAALAQKRPDLRIDRAHDRESEPTFAGILDEVHIDGFRLAESVLVHRPTKTLVVADLVHNIGRPRHPWTKLYTRMMGFYDRVALSRMIRWAGFSDRAAARASLDELLALSFDRLVVGHGEPLESGGREAIAAAYRWLRPLRAEHETDGA